MTHWTVWCRQNLICSCKFERCHFLLIVFWLSSLLILLINAFVSSALLSLIIDCYQLLFVFGVFDKIGWSACSDLANKWICSLIHSVEPVFPHYQWVASNYFWQSQSTFYCHDQVVIIYLPWFGLFWNLVGFCTYSNFLIF